MYDMHLCTFTAMARQRSPRVVREPVQVYLAPDDRKLLEQLVHTTGLSRAEILRRGLRSFAAAAQGAASPMLELLDRLSGADWPAGVAEDHDAYLAGAHRPARPGRDG